MITRLDGRDFNELRPVRITPSYLKHAEGSALIEMGDTRVICAASLEEKVPPFLKNKGKGWVTAEYAMLPRSTPERMVREAARGRLGGRTHEIQRLIGRALRAVVDLSGLGERTLWIDCDVIQADGGTRTASITGAFVAMVDACRFAMKQGKFSRMPVQDYLGAVSVGRVGGDLLLDLNYAEDSRAEVDMNVVQTGLGSFVEVQGTGERSTFTQAEMDQFLTLAGQGIDQLIQSQKDLLGPVLSSG